MVGVLSSVSEYVSFPTNFLNFFAAMVGKWTEMAEEGKRRDGGAEDRGQDGELFICAVISQLSVGQLHHLLVIEQSAAAQIHRVNS